MGKTYDVTALGELLIDFTDSGLSPQGNPLLEANPGGAPCNVLSMLQRLGARTAFIGKVGDDGFGHMLEKTIQEQGIDSSGLCFDAAVHTTLALVLKKADGDRDFSFYRNPGADIMLSKDQVRTDLIEQSRIFHFGSLSLTDEPVRNATQLAVDTAKKAVCLFSFDPNLREPLWPSLDDAHQQIDWGMKQCDYLKISDNEIVWFTGKDDYQEGIDALFAQYPNIRLITLSMGADGSVGCTRQFRVNVPAYLQEGTIETTGAGDTFCACVLKMILDHGIDGLNEEVVSKGLHFANAAASIVTTRKGALRVMPSIEEVEALITQRA